MSVKKPDTTPELPDLVIEHGKSRLRLSLQGAHITEYSVDEDNLLWVSESARYAPGVAIRGGIPLCWPWFGASMDDEEWPQHGFARTSPFQVLSRHSDARGSSVLIALDDSAAVPQWRGAASLEVEVRLSDCVCMELRTTNTSDSDLLVGAGLHSYFRVSDCHEIAIPVLTGLDYLDKPAGFARKTQIDALRIGGEIDRVYLNPPRRTKLIDPACSRTIEIETWGNTDLVVWNPGPEVAAAIGDFDNDGYLRMVCIEPAIALDKRIHLKPGECHVIGQTIRMLRE